MTEESDDLRSAGRLHDGWAYAVTLRSGQTLVFHDHDALSAVEARWRRGEGSTSEVLSFSGASESSSDGSEIGPVDGRGVVRSDEVVAIRYMGPATMIAQESALGAARAMLEIQQAAMEEIQTRTEGATMPESDVGRDPLSMALLGRKQGG